jgi:hypothetical protein
VVREPLPPDTGDFRSLWENITNDRVENPLKVGGNARGLQGQPRRGAHEASPKLYAIRHPPEVCTAQLQTGRASWFRIQMGDLDQWIDLVAQPRHFGGRQWYFRSLVTGRRCSVLWIPPGARRFCGRHEWGRQVAYASQFGTPVDRAHRGKARIKARLIGDGDPDDWELPPKPKWMRWHTYNKQVDKFDHYEGMLGTLCRQALMRILRRG